MTPQEALRLYADDERRWFHSIEIEPGVWTRGLKSREVMAAEARDWRFPSDLSGMAVLDIGCADGGFGIEAIRRGARVVLGIDDQQTIGMSNLRSAGIFPSLKFRRISLFSDEFLALPQYDLVIFAGVLYHVQDPLDALKRVRSKARGQVILETIFDETLGAWPPYARFFENDECFGDPTNWWAPNFACLEGLLRTAGFSFERSWMRGDDARNLTGRVSYLLT